MGRAHVVPTLRIARQRARYLGLKGALATAATEMAPGLTLRLQQLVGHPSLFELFNLQEGGVVISTAREVLEAIMPVQEGEWSGIEAEFVEVDRHLEQRRNHAIFPEFFAVERQTSLLIYGLTRLAKPTCIVETGVADGASTLVFLDALRANGTGELHSLDVHPNVGSMVDDKRSWHLHVSAEGTAGDALVDLFMGLPPVDLFFHDSDHRFLPQLCELEIAYANMRPGSLILSDDVDYSYAFETFCRRHGFKPAQLCDTRKVTGLVRL